MAVSDQQLMQEDRNQLAIVPDRASVSHGADRACGGRDLI